MTNYDRLQAVMHAYSAWVRTSARGVLPFVEPAGKSIVDFGCGQGDWLLEARALGAATVLGLETYALEGGATLPIPSIAADLTAPITLDRRFDIALCLEVGEHIDAVHAGRLVASLTQAAPVVLFSAAVPGQGGVGHINEQPPAYWNAKFRAHGFDCFDFRHEIWADHNIEPWYAMNVLAFAAPASVPGQLAPYRTDEPLHLIHPAVFAARVAPIPDVIYHYDRQPGRWWTEALG